MNDLTNDDTAPTGPPPGEVKLVITLNTRGNVTVEGPIANKVLCYGLLESAKDALRSYEASQQRITPAMRLPSEFKL